ncbi:MAG: hypothetical protein DSY83_08350 [Flavobacteriia bacterium]|nr:MAG: hypothetical protein DSY83_08350 [Flavobacteriia bacterium]
MKNQLILLGSRLFSVKNAFALLPYKSANPHKQGPCAATMIGRTRERATLLLLLFAPGAQKVSHNMGQFR